MKVEFLISIYCLISNVFIFFFQNKIQNQVKQMSEHINLTYIEDENKIIRK